MNKEEMYLRTMSYPKYSNRKQYSPKYSIIVSPPDKVLMVVVAFLVIIGLMSIFSASAPKCIEAGINPIKFVAQQFVFMILGIVGIKFFANYDYKNLVPWTMMVSMIVIALLALVGLTPLGLTVNNSTRWLALGPLSFQPSEFSKLAVVLLLASAFCKNPRITQQKMVYFFPILIMVLFIFKQPNLSMVILLGMTSLIMWLSAGGPLKAAMITIFGGGGFVALNIYTALNGMWSLLKPYQLTRITTWLNPELDSQGAGYQIVQSLTAFATGGFFGVGFGNSKQKLFWLPESHTDFIYSVIGEELGFIGCVLVIGLFWTFIHRGLIIASRCPDMYGKLLAVGITFSIGFQAFLNISVTCSFLPATGVPLPFISYGGSSLMVTLWMIGILLNISKTRIKKIREKSNVRYI